MSREIIVTDLTRFSDDRVCLAGIDLNNMELIRPMPYNNQTWCRANNILPGSKILAEFTPISSTPPHTEDYQWENIRIIGHVTSDEFHDLLVATLSESICQGFGININNKVITAENVPNHSIITVKASVELHPGYNNDLTKIRANVTDEAHLSLGYLPITDLGFHRFASSLTTQTGLRKLNDFITSQGEVFVRLGLSRFYKAPADDRVGYWIQVNGIYTFPEFSEKIRSYE